MVVGYALVMTKEFSSHIPVLGPMFETFKKISYQGKILDNYSFYVMGQICISETYRGQGILENSITPTKDTIQILLIYA